jgi:hypothetical protein
MVPAKSWTFVVFDTVEGVQAALQRYGGQGGDARGRLVIGGVVVDVERDVGQAQQGKKRKQSLSI